MIACFAANHTKYRQIVSLSFAFSGIDDGFKAISELMSQITSWQVQTHGRQSHVCGIQASSCLMVALTLSQWSSSGNPVAIQCAWNLDPSVHWNATGEMPVCFQWSSSGLPVAFQWSSSVFQLCKLTLDRHWDTTGCKRQPVWFQWSSSVFQLCKLTLDRQWNTTGC